MARRGGRFLLALVLVAPNAWADGDEEEVRVRGAAGNFSSRASIADSPREVTDAASLVEPLPGVHVRRLGADDSFATLSIRGSSSAQVAVYLAGVPLSGGADPTLDLATLPLWPGARATVHRTFAPAALGRGSLGGTLVLDPPSARAKEQTEVWAAAGSFGSRRLRIGNITQLTHDNEPLSYSRLSGGTRVEASGIRLATGLSASRSDDDFSYLDSGATGAAGRDVLTTRQNAGHAAASGLASIAIPIDTRSGEGAVTITTLLQARRQQLPGAASFPTPRQELASSRLVESLELTLPNGFGARAWGRREALSIRDDPRYGTIFGPSHTDDAILAAGGSLGWRGRPLERTTIEARIDGSAERFAPGTWVDGVAPPGARRTNTGLALDASHLAFDRVTFAASGRADFWFDASDVGTSKSQERPTGHVGVEAPIGPVVVATHAGWVTRPPSFVERYGNRGAFLGNPALKSESAFTVDAGANLARRVGPLRLRAELAGFATFADDLITFAYTGAARRARAVNIDQARLFGIESSLRASAYGVDARVSYTGLATFNDGACVTTETNRCERPPLISRPANDLVVDVAYERGPVRLRYGIDYVNGIHPTLEDDSSVVVPPRVLHGASVRLAVPGVRGLSLTLDVRNLFDLRGADYVDFSVPSRRPIGDLYDYPLPGRRVLLSARWSFSGT